VKRAEFDEQRTDSAIRLQVRRAFAGLRAAQERIQVARAAVAQAEESLRITQNRYEAGMNNVTDLLRTETAVLESRTRYLARRFPCAKGRSRCSSPLHTCSA